MTTQKQHRAIIRFKLLGKKTAGINYGRRMYAIIRRYTPDAAIGAESECFAELTGLRTFFKMTYAELADTIRKDLLVELGEQFSVHVATPLHFEQALKMSKKTKTVSTYKEINSLFAGKSFVAAPLRKVTHTGRVTKKIRLVVPFLGKVA